MRIVGVEIPDNKPVGISLTYIFGIGRTSATKICEKAKIDWNKRVKDLTEEEKLKLLNIIKEEFETEGDLRRKVALNIKRLAEIRSYRGIRHRKGLPVRGQNTKNNARTRKGGKKTVANKKKVTK